MEIRGGVGAQDMKQVCRVRTVVLFGLLVLLLVGCAPVRSSVDEISGTWALSTKRSIGLTGSIGAPGTMRFNPDGTGTVDGLSKEVFVGGLGEDSLHGVPFTWEIVKGGSDLENDRIELEISMPEGGVLTSLDTERDSGNVVIFRIVDPDKPTIAQFMKT
jgi:hypothetical protein